MLHQLIDLLDGHALRLGRSELTARMQQPADGLRNVELQRFLAGGEVVALDVG